MKLKARSKSVAPYSRPVMRRQPVAGEGVGSTAASRNGECGSGGLRSVHETTVFNNKGCRVTKCEVLTAVDGHAHNYYTVLQKDSIQSIELD
jgi:hypothetical protein